ncbi:MAG: Kelch repeat-containing protein, partial [Myxococcaceae bacterium]
MKIRADWVRAGWVWLTLALAAACGGSPPAASDSLKSALAGHALGIGVTLGEPSRLQLLTGASQYTYGVAPDGEPGAPGHSKSIHLGARAQLRLGLKSSEVSVFEAGSPAGVKLRPVDGPLKFSSWGTGVASGEAVVYASRDGEAAVVERASREGLKEDIVLTRSLGDSLRFEWELELGEGLEARLGEDGSVGVYGMSSLLSGDIQVGDDKSRALLEKARGQAGKTELRFRIPAPTVRVATGKTVEGVAHLELGKTTGSTVALGLVAMGLDALAYPLSIDPSVVVTSTADFGLGGNLEGGADLDVGGGRVRRGKTQIGVGAFTATTSFPTARYGHTSVAYNGYLYVIGGYGTGFLSDVQVAPINANGTLGAFAATTSLTTARAGHASVAYNGYLYVIGGEGGTNLSDVQVARINSNGTLGAFAATSSFATARRGHTSVAYNGYLYVIGGDGGGYLSDVQWAPLNADGTLGAFTGTTSFTNARAYHTSVAYNGHLYVIGGLGGTGSLKDVQVAPINANGLLGAFAATSSFTNARRAHTTVAYDGYLYVIGGSNTGTPYDDAQVAPINANGTLGAFTATTSLTTARYGHTSVAYNGYLYVIGGNGGPNLNDVQVAPVNANGTLGAFTATTSVTTVRSGHTSVAYNGYLYVIGGNDGGVGFLSDVLQATINADGTLGAFTATTSFTTGRYFHASVVYNDYLYVMGGNSAGGALS